MPERVPRSVCGGLRAKIQPVLDSSPFLRHVLTLLSGTVVAQALVLVIELALARVYAPEQAGRFALFMSVASILIVLASGRYDMTIMLPRSDTQARVVKKLATRIIVSVSVVSSAACIVFYPWVRDFYGGDTELALVFTLVGVCVFLVADLAALQYWFNRKSDYATIAINRVQQSVGSALGKLVFGLLGLNTVSGLFLGQSAGQLLAWLNLTRKSKELRSPLPQDAPSCAQMAKKYRRMPLLNGPNALIDAIRANGINMLIASVALGSLGQFDKAWTLLQAPIALINGAIGQVFFQKLATVEPGEMLALVRFVLKRAFLVGIVPFTLLYFLSPWLFPLMLGQQWDESGIFAQALVPWLFMTLLASPISQIFVVTQTQHWLLGFSIVYCIAPLSLLYFARWHLHLTITLLGVLMAVMLSIMLLLAILSARRFDRQAHNDALVGIP